MVLFNIDSIFEKNKISHAIFKTTGNKRALYHKF